VYIYLGALYVDISRGTLNGYNYIGAISGDIFRSTLGEIYFLFNAYLKKI